MRVNLLRSLFIAGVAFFPLALAVPGATPANAQVIVSQEFRTALAPYGSWEQSRRWGDVWIPARLPQSWRPYTVGHWIYTNDYGWYWVPEGDEAAWGLVAFHYGHWVYDDEFGWMWIPGTEWGPGWVEWRRGGGYVGWAPLPPEAGYSYSPALWAFVRERDLLAPYIAEVVLPPSQVYFENTIVVSRAEFLSRGYAINPGVPPEAVALAYGRPIPEYELHPGIFAGTKTWPGALVLRPEDFRNPGRLREVTRQSMGREVSRIAPGAAAQRNGAFGQVPQPGQLPRTGARNRGGEIGAQDRQPFGQERRQGMYAPPPRGQPQPPGTNGVGLPRGRYGGGFGEPTHPGARPFTGRAPAGSLAGTAPNRQTMPRGGLVRR
jgi:hypothetical protein